MNSTVLAVPSWEAVAELPKSLAKMSRAKKSALVISAVVLESGKTAVVSRFGDSIWRLEAYIHGAGVADNEKYVEWPDDIPAVMIDDLKAACLAWKQRGRNEAAPPRWQTVRLTAVLGITFARWLLSHGVKQFDAIRPLHLANYLHHCRSELQLVPGGVRHRIGIIDLLWRYRHDLMCPLTFVPWEGRSVTAVAGGGRGFETALTPVIPRPVQEQIYSHCMSVIEQAEGPGGFSVGRTQELAQQGVVAIRDACMYILSICTGARNDEIVSVERGAYREEVTGGVTYRWLKMTENKTGKGPVEYLCPAVAGRVVRLLERWVQPFHDVLNEEIRALEAQPSTAERDLRLMKARADARRLFLCTASSTGWKIGSVSSHASREGLQRTARAAGVDWQLNPHQTRRTYARMVVESRMGRASLVFLKWQLKHSTITMTQGYGSNPIADRTLFEDFLDEMSMFKTELLDSWTLDTPLSGGAGRAIMTLRATPHESRDALLKSAAQHIHIRATGHGWCLAESRGCGGAGLYEATRCVSCKDGVIDPSFAETWQQIHAQQRELLDLDDAGPAVRKRAEREVSLSAVVLRDLGLAAD
jgi:integrase